MNKTTLFVLSVFKTTHFKCNEKNYFVCDHMTMTRKRYHHDFFFYRNSVCDFIRSFEWREHELDGIERKVTNKRKKKSITKQNIDFFHLDTVRVRPLAPKCVSTREPTNNKRLCHWWFTKIAYLFNVIDYATLCYGLIFYLSKYFLSKLIIMCRHDIGNNVYFQQKFGSIPFILF